MALFYSAVLAMASEKSELKPMELFNGRDLSHWSAVLAKPEARMEDVFSVSNGMIVCKGDPLGFIQTDKKFVNFRLVVEWRWAPGTKPGNSGVFLRINGPPSPLPRCLECQLKSGDAGDIYGFHGMKVDGDPARRVEVRHHQLGGDFVGVKKRYANENRPGQWNRFEIEIYGRDLTIKVNERVVNEAKDCEWVYGPIGLQSEGGEIHFRTVRVIPLQ